MECRHVLWVTHYSAVIKYVILKATTISMYNCIVALNLTI